MIGPGKYDLVLADALRTAGANQGLLIVVDGTSGPGFSAQLTLEHTFAIPKILRQVADQIEEDHKKGII